MPIDTHFKNLVFSEIDYTASHLYVSGHCPAVYKGLRHRSFYLPSKWGGEGQVGEPHFTDGTGKKRGWSARDMVGQLASAGGGARSRALFPDAIFSGMRVPSKVSRTGPAKTRLPVELSCFDIAEAVGLRAGQQQDVSLFKTKHTHHTEVPKAKLSSRAAGRVRDVGCGASSLTGIKSFFFRRMTSPT